MSQRDAGDLENDRRDLGGVTISFAQGLELVVVIDAGNSAVRPQGASRSDPRRSGLHR